MFERHGIQRREHLAGRRAGLFAEAPFALSCLGETQRGSETVPRRARAIRQRAPRLAPRAQQSHVARLSLHTSDRAEITHVESNGMQLPNGAMLKRRVKALERAGLIEARVGRAFIAENSADDANGRLSADRRKR